MGEESKLYFRKRGNWFKELLYKIKILKPKYKELGKIVFDYYIHMEDIQDEES